MIESFYVEAHWDDENKLFYSISNIQGLNIETDTLEEFEEVVLASASELVYVNHISKREKENVDRKNWSGKAIAGKILKRLSTISDDSCTDPQSDLYLPIIRMDFDKARQAVRT
ncbi:MAG: hypothetical protein V6Z81_04450 [Parvularculales bacterium]